jgi:hypothetical protein
LNTIFIPFSILVVVLQVLVGAQYLKAESVEGEERRGEERR